eukprot:6301821-Amphidinium_carterae.1
MECLTIVKKSEHDKRFKSKTPINAEGRALHQFKRQDENYSGHAQRSETLFATWSTWMPNKRRLNQTLQLQGKRSTLVSEYACPSLGTTLKHA